ncbi:hypothetical protein [Hymenobacter metallicola]|uniref:Uncharacterized protein n=1 Tax=Hymenobacter metallicola TaxID=2563114 RepID=A0A4Z0QE84_9BACT|nr:hypothetical protein [Hymenobacter metallicola]TGE28367.1 hypothetical protein E5K02_02560 [Hymenobacter metallicola]
MKTSSTDADQPRSGLEKTTIPLKEAQERVKWWLHAAGKMPPFKDDPGAVPRAIFIKLEDISELMAAYPDIKGIRVYFGLNEKGSTEITGLVVPVIQMEDHTYQDRIRGGDDPEKTAVYDFTAPCPIYCDTASELYVPYDGNNS